MTENEAKNVLDNVWDFAISADDESGDILEKAIDIANKALEEIQQYRAIGTIEYFKLLQGHYRNLNEICKEYSAIGTIEELQALKENQRKCEECAGCTEWMCDCANVRDKAIDEFAERMKELINKWIEKGYIRTNSIDEIAEQMKKENQEK